MCKKTSVLIALAILLVSACLILPGCDDSKDEKNAYDIGLSVKTPEPPLVTNTDYTFVAESLYPQFLSENPYYDWDFSDTGMGIYRTFENEVTTAFTKGGEHTIRVEVFESDEADAPSLGVATARVTVEADIGITETDLITIDLGTPAYQKNREEPVWQRWQFGGDFGPDQWKGLLNWDGTNFSYVFTSDQGELIWREEVKGSVTEEDGKFFVSLYASEVDEWKSDVGIEPGANLKLKNVPLTPVTIDPYPTSFVFDLTGTGVKEYVEAMGHVNFKSAVWTDESILWISFDKVLEE